MCRCFLPEGNWGGKKRKQAHGSSLSTKFAASELRLGSRDEALLWICNNQLNKRNLNTNERSYYQAKRYELQKQPHGAQKGNTNAKKRSGKSYHSEKTTGKTAKAVAKQDGVSEKTVRDVVSQISADLPKSAKVLSEFADPDFDPPLYKWRVVLPPFLNWWSSNGERP
jgi:hypothetical protein